MSSATKLYGIIGWPTRHSLSPKMHEAAFSALQIDARYIAFEVEPRKISQAITGLVALGFSGFNVTAPFKERVIPCLDLISDEATQIGAVNTVVISDEGDTRGCNTDACGFSRHLRNQGIDVRDKKVVVLGTGGAARSVIFSLLAFGCAAIYIVNRHHSNATKLAQHFHRQFPSANFICAKEGDFDEADDILLVVNCTGDLALLRRFILLVKPRYAEELSYGNHSVFSQEFYGTSFNNGLEMLVYQGAESFKIWTGEDAPTDLMRRVVNPFAE